MSSLNNGWEQIDFDKIKVGDILIVEKPEFTHLIKVLGISTTTFASVSGIFKDTEAETPYFKYGNPKVFHRTDNALYYRQPYDL